MQGAGSGAVQALAAFVCQLTGIHPLSETLASFQTLRDRCGDLGSAALAVLCACADADLLHLLPLLQSTPAENPYPALNFRKLGYQYTYVFQMPFESN